MTNSQYSNKDYDKILEILEDLQRMVEAYDPIMYSSSPESKELSNQISELYGSIEVIYTEIQLFELRNLITVAYLIVEQSLARKENSGVFYNTDLE